jgi:Tol biopolymer transport system component
MPLSAGTRLGPYEILAPIGAGGMGEVYRARDKRLDRAVAIKIAAERFSERFEREARAVAALNHPNICTLFDVGPNYLVMELVDGPTLAERIAAGRIALPESLVIARQMAEALEAAHEKGITHRDLKPANVKLTADGNVKVLDFGLAKASGCDSVAAGNPTSSPTQTLSVTRAGTILGTAAYMSPEQARGMPVDKRADIWAYGVVLYEMLTGRHSFAGETVSDTLAAVLKTDPDWSALPAETPQPIRRLLRRALERDRKRRLPDIAVARLEIDEAMAGSPETPAVATQPASRAILPWCIAALALVAFGVALALGHFREQPAERPVVRFQIPAPEKASFSTGLSLSPDGRRLAFVATDTGGRQMLWVRALDSLDLRELPGTEGANFPFWSPDNRFIGFSVQGKVKKINTSGGPAQTVCEPGGVLTGGSWNRDGIILFGSPNTGLFQVSQAGGIAAPLTTLDTSNGETGHMRPCFLPDGRHFLYIAMNSALDGSAIFLASLDDKDRKRLVLSRQAAAYAPPTAPSDKGHILFLREDTLMAQPFDEQRFDVMGEAFPVAEQVGFVRALGLFSVSTNGVLAHRSGGDSGNSRLVWFDRQGNSKGVLGAAGLYRGVGLSPDGNKVAVARDDPQSANSDIWILDVQRGVPNRFTFDPARQADPVWSSEGSIMFSSAGRTPTPGIFQKDYGKGGKEELMVRMDTPIRANDWSPDGRYVLYAKSDPKTKWDLWTLPTGLQRTGASPTPEPYLRTPFNESQGQFSPDGHWVAYTSDEAGRSQVYVQSFPAGAGKFLVSSSDGTQPRWRKDGKELFYIAGDGKLMAVEVKTAPAFEAGAARALFDSRISRSGEVTNPFHYAVTADGKRFLIISNADATEASHSTPVPITVVLNWTAGLKR